jgi:hypothetical protein
MIDDHRLYPHPQRIASFDRVLGDARGEALRASFTAIIGLTFRAYARI